MRGPIQCAEKGARGDRRVGRAQGVPANPVGDERPDAALVAIALRDDRRPQPRRQRMDLEMRRGSLEFVHETQDVRDGEVAKPRRHWPARSPRARQCLQHPVERAALTEVEDLVLALEVVIQDAWRKIGGGRDVAHAGSCEADRAERPRGRAKDLDAARFGAV
jgi:hypothetical protein